MRSRQSLTVLPGLLLLLAGGASAFAQSDARERRSDQRDRSRSTQRDSDYWRNNDESYWDTEDWNVDLDFDQTAWVRIAYDYDDDGEYDAYGYVYALDLQELLDTTRTRQDRDMQRRMGRRDGRRSDRGQGYRVQGELTQLKTLRLQDIRSPHLMGKIETRQGRTVRVDFGPEQRVQRHLDLADGDRITVQGKRGRINGKRMLLAQRVRHDGDTFNVRRQRGPGYRQFQGRIASIRTATLRGDDNRHVIADIRARGQKTRRVALGTQQQVDRIGLQEGDRVKFLAHPARIDGERGLVAKQISFEGDTYRVNKQMRRSGRAEQAGRRDRLRWSRSRAERAHTRKSDDQRSYHVRGELVNLKTIKLSGIRDRHLCGKVETSRGDTIKVDFGPKQRIQRRFDLQDGDQIAVMGRRGRINGKSMLLATKVMAGGDSLSIERQKGQGFRRFSGKVVSTESMRLRGDGSDKHMVATVRLENGQRRKVALGTKSSVNDIGISTGDRVTFLATPCKINGERGLVARQIRYDGGTHRVNEELRQSRRESRRAD